MDIFQTLSPQHLSIAAYSMVVLGYFVTYFFKRPWFLLIVFVALGLGYVANHVTYIGVLVTLGVAYLALTMSAYMSKFSQIFLWVLVVALSVAIYQHSVPGFHNWLIIDGVQISSKSKPLMMYLNFDKGIIGLILFSVVASRIELGTLIYKLQEATAVIIISMLVLISVSFWMGYINYDLKLPSITALWLVTNFFFVCIPEEVLYRGLMLKYLSIWIGKYAALIISTAAFVGLHWSAGMDFMILAGIAGLFYGWAYIRFKSIEVSIMTHFIVNATHFFVFSYPALA